MKRCALFVCVLFFIADWATAGTLTPLSGEQLTFSSEKEFVAIVLEEFLPPGFVHESGFFLVSDRSEEKHVLHKLLVETAELELSEYNPTAIYSSIDALLQSTEYTEMGERTGYENLFAVEIALKELDMIYVHRLPSPTKTRALPSHNEPSIIIDATGEGGFEMLEE